MDKGIICEIKADDQSAFNDAYFRYHKQIYSFVFNKTQSEHIATEVVQLSFIRLWENRKSLNENLNLNVQLFGMARQVMIDELRKESTRMKYSRASNDRPFTDNLMKMIESRDLLKHFELEIEAMPPMRKMVFKLSRDNGLSYAEIGGMLGISTKTVESHIGKVLSRLKTYMYSILL
jgi:RNA polymerase sigma-70 factor (ECF subfamily)